jgi:hypothetical protein
VDDAITMTMPGTSYSVTYRKPGKTPWLVASDIRDDFNYGVGKSTNGAGGWLH